MTSPAPPPAASEVGQPEWRAAVLAEAIRRTAHLSDPINPFPLMIHLRDWLGLTEEECLGELTTVVFTMASTGLYTINTFDAETRAIWLGAETRLTPSKTLTLMLHGEAERVWVDDDT